MKLVLNLKNTLAFLLSYAAYWLLLSEIDRLLFLISTSDYEQGNFFVNFLDTWKAGLKMDISLTGYLLALPFLFYVVQLLFIKKPVSRWWLWGYTLVPTVIFAAITVGNILLYNSWNEKVSKRALLMGLETPEGVLSSLDSGLFFKGAIVLIVFFAWAHYFYHGVVVRFARNAVQGISVTLLIFIFGTGLVFTMIRGGYGRANITPSIAYYSEISTLNHAAVNTYWALLKDLTISAQKNPYTFMPEDEARALIDRCLSVHVDTVYPILKTDRPNVVLVILEGIVAQVFESLGGEQDVTPRMAQLMAEGVNFTKAYAASDRSDKGMVAILSGFPAQGPESIIQHISKHEKLPAITQIYDSLGYATSFYHGGQSEFYNFKSFMFAHGVNKVVDDSSFSMDAPRVSWGVYDHVVAKRMLTELNQETKPFFSIFYTVVNHEPFDMKQSYRFGNDTRANAYRSTVYYTDSVLFDLVEQAKQQLWYDHTVFVVVSDHGHVYPQEKYDLSRPERYHIPLFMFGGALEDRY
ncbi:MAG TPA: sulfatase-like hydrolase/transferase, partial [Sphingobacterium sp.]|nr:sulfatase-like hydrolase/transferase [Sphingobacterium sp.]